MSAHIKDPSVITAAGNKPKLIEEFIGKINSSDDDISIARMKSPPGWVEPGQTPDFDEYTFVLKGSVNIKTKESSYTVETGEIFIAHKGEWVQYSTPGPDGAEYISICTPAFSPDTVHRDD